MSEKELNEFLLKYAENKHTEQEHELFLRWMKAAPLAEVEKIMERYLAISEESSNGSPEIDVTVKQKIESRLDDFSVTEYPSRPSAQTVFSIRKAMAVAASLLIITAFGLYLWFNPAKQSSHVSQIQVPRYKDEVRPGTDKAILTLADGSVVVLENAGEGELAQQAGVSIRKLKNGTLSYHYSSATSDEETAEAAYNTVTTPRKGQYQLVLPDGSRVWLNAASSLRFPAAFSQNERRLELTGEAYFEVAKDKKRPFRVVSGNQTVEVLGTHFNVNAYPDEVTINTTLVEGSVKISQSGTGNSLLIKPGQQSRMGTGIQVMEVDTEQAVAWKEGQFVFDREKIGSIMRKLSRWYDVEVEYHGKITDEEFVGSVSRYENISEILATLELTGLVHFKIEGRRIIVMP